MPDTLRPLTREPAPQTATDPSPIRPPTLWFRSQRSFPGTLQASPYKKGSDQTAAGRPPRSQELLPLTFLRLHQKWNSWAREKVGARFYPLVV